MLKSMHPLRIGTRRFDFDNGRFHALAFFLPGRSRSRSVALLAGRLRSLKLMDFAPYLLGLFPRWEKNCGESTNTQRRATVRHQGDVLKITELESTARLRAPGNRARRFIVKMPQRVPDSDAYESYRCPFKAPRLICAGT